MMESALSLHLHLPVWSVSFSCLTQLGYTHQKLKEPKWLKQWGSILSHIIWSILGWLPFVPDMRDTVISTTITLEILFTSLLHWVSSFLLAPMEQPPVAFLEGGDFWNNSRGYKGYSPLLFLMSHFGQQILGHVLFMVHGRSTKWWAKTSLKSVQPSWSAHILLIRQVKWKSPTLTEAGVNHAKDRW